MPHKLFCPGPRDTAVPASGPPTPPATVVMFPATAACWTPAPPACARPSPQVSAAADTSVSTEATTAGRPSPPDRSLFMTRPPQRFPKEPNRWIRSELEGAAICLAHGLRVGDGDVRVRGDGLDDLLPVRIAVPHRDVRPVLGRIRRGAVPPVHVAGVLRVGAGDQDVCLEYVPLAG